MTTHPGSESKLLLDDMDKMGKMDPGGVVNVSIGFSSQLEGALRISCDIGLPDDLRGLKNIVTIGVGGSGISGDITRELISCDVKVPVVVVKDYDLPAFVDHETLVFASSYSGNTEETLSAYEIARARGAKIICVTSGGQLLENSIRDNVPVIVVPTGFPPRCALAYLFTPILVTLGRLGYIEDKIEAMNEAIQLIADLTTVICPAAPASVNQAKRLAQAIYGKVPLIYGSTGITSAAALRWKAQINESSKTHAFWNVFPELTHNEVVGWSARPEISKAIHVVFLRDRDDHPRAQQMIEITKELMAGAAGISEVFSRGKKESGLSLIHMGISPAYIWHFFTVRILSLSRPLIISKISWAGGVWLLMGKSLVIGVDLGGTRWRLLLLILMDYSVKS